MDRRKVLSASAVARPRRARRLRHRRVRRAPSAGGSRTVFSVAQPMLPIVGTSEMFPVRRIYCIGRNYAAHAREMGSDPTREPPFFFQKPSDAIQFVAPGTTADHPYPTLTKNYHYEIELVAALDKGGRNVPVEQALDLRLRLRGRPRHDPARPAARRWATRRSRGRSARASTARRRSGRSTASPQIGHFTKGAISLKVNGVVKQNADLSYDDLERRRADLAGSARRSS